MHSSCKTSIVCSNFLDPGFCTSLELNTLNVTSLRILYA